MSFFLELSMRPIEFGAASSVNAVFFDETNSEVISVNNDAEIVINSQNYQRNEKSVKEHVNKLILIQLFGVQS